MSLFDQIDEQRAKLFVLKAAEAELIDGPDAALEVLGPPTDAIRMKATLGILVRAYRYKIAADLIRDQRADERWIHLAVIAFASLEEFSRALALVGQADESVDLSVMRSSRLAFAEGVIEAWRTRKPDESLLGPKVWPDNDVELAKRVIDILDPLLSSVRANRKIVGDYELEAVIFAVYCASIARDREFLSQYIHWLIKYVPIPLLIAELCLRGLTSPTPIGLSNRLRVEHPGSFQAAFLAAIVERDLFQNPKAAFESLVDLSAKAPSESEKESLCIALFETCGNCGPDQIEKSIQVVTQLKPESDRFQGLLRAMKFLADGNVLEATAHLNTIRDESDGVWWQAQAQFCERAGDEAGAELAWKKASELVPHPDVLRRSIQASIDRRRYQSAIRGLTKLLEQDPNDEKHLKTLAWAQIQIGDHAQASRHLRQLVKLNSSNRDYRIWLAKSLASTAQIGEAITILKPVSQDEDAPLESILFLSELMAAGGNAEDAFKVLKALTPDYWDDPRFLFSYMQRCHAASQERLAQEAFARILELRQEGKIPAELMQEGTIEELLESGNGFRSRREALQQALIDGRMPWLFASEALGCPAAWAWTLHTQELKWLSEEPLTRAAFSIYATNGFTVDSTPTGKRLVGIVAPPADTTVVADLSALLTLRKLNLLDKAADYFGCIVLPTSYGGLKVRDCDRFGQQQPSREQELRAITENVECRRIQVSALNPEGILILDEHSDDPDKHVYRLRDLVPLLRSTQRVPMAVLDKWSKLAHKPAAADETHPSFVLGDAVLVAVSTLRRFTEEPIFGHILDVLKIYIRETEYQAVLSELRAHEAARVARQFDDALWLTVADLAKRGTIKWEPVPKSADGPDAELEDEVSTDAIRLSQHLKCPLLVDDRVIQVLSYGDSFGGPLPAFGSDCVIQAMLENGVYDATSAARNFRLLMNWRYRFVVPSADVLLAWAEDSLTNLPGPGLLDAAFYLQDSLRDPGLHYGPELSEPPMPMAIKYAIAWIHSTVKFIANVWSSSKFSDESCMTLTQWVGEELIPSCPHGLWYQSAGHNYSYAERLSVFSLAMVQFTGIGGRDRANLALRTLAESLSLSDDHYFLAAADAIHASMGVDEISCGNGDQIETFHQVEMQNALFHVRNKPLDALAFSRFRELGFFQNNEPPTVSDSLIDSMREASRTANIKADGGHLYFFHDNDVVNVIEVENILLHPKLELRQAALDYLRAADQSSEQWLTSHSSDTLERNFADIASTDNERWRAAAINMATVLRQDVLALFASVRTSWRWKFQKGIHDFSRDAIRPGFEILQNFRPPVWNPSQQRDEIILWITELSKLPLIDDALSGYLHRCGYVPLSRDLSASKVVSEWMASHSDAEITWSVIWGWAIRQSTPIAQYHAITIALHCPALRPVDDWEHFWVETINVLNMIQVSEQIGSVEADWPLYCELGAHFARHLEALHPAQHGDSIACYAWWLASKVGTFLTEVKNKEMLTKQVLLPEFQRSYFRWVVARSPVVTSPMRYATLQLRSVWAASLLTSLGMAAKSLPHETMPAKLRRTLTDILHGYILTVPNSRNQRVTDVAFAIEEAVAIEELCDVEGFVKKEVRDNLKHLIEIRKKLSAVDQMKSYLDQFLALPPDDQYLLVLALRDAVLTTTTFDFTLEKWLEQTVDIVAILTEGSEELVRILLDVLAEFQQHQVGNWPIRLPHLLAYVIEGVDDPVRIRLLARHVLQLSANAGIGSAILRLASSGKWSKWPIEMESWRQNLQAMAIDSEPWLAGRVRLISTTISRLIGPIRRKEPEESGHERVVGPSVP